MKSILSAALLGAVALSVSPAHAAENKPLKLSIEGGIQYDNNITVDQADLTANQGDEAFVVDAGGSYTFGDEKKLQIEAGYDFYQSLHFDLSNFDLQIHTLSLSARHTVGKADLAFDYDFIPVLLGGHSFLTLQIFRPNVGFLVTNKLYLVGAFEYRHKGFHVLKPRNADDLGGSLQAFYVIHPKNSVNFGIRLLHENAAAPEFTYWSHRFDLGYRTPVSFGAIKPTWRIAYFYLRRDYSNITPSIGAKRHDTRNDIKTSLSFPLGKHFALKTQYEFINSNSNLPVIDYNEHILTGTVAWTL